MGRVLSVNLRTLGKASFDHGFVVFQSVIDISHRRLVFRFIGADVVQCALDTGGIW